MQRQLRPVSSFLASCSAAAAAGGDLERVIAKVNGEIVTLSDFQARQVAAAQAARVEPDQVEKFLRENNAKILQDAVDDLLLVQRAAELGLRAAARVRQGRDREHQEGEQHRDATKTPAAARARGHVAGRPEAQHRALDRAAPDAARGRSSPRSRSRDAEARRSTRPARTSTQAGHRAACRRSWSRARARGAGASRASSAPARARTSRRWRARIRRRPRARRRGPRAAGARRHEPGAREGAPSRWPRARSPSPCPRGEGYRILKVTRARPRRSVVPFDEAKEEIRSGSRSSAREGVRASTWPTCARRRSSHVRVREVPLQLRGPFPRTRCSTACSEARSSRRVRRLRRRERRGGTAPAAPPRRPEPARAPTPSSRRRRRSGPSASRRPRRRPPTEAAERRSPRAPSAVHGGRLLRRGLRRGARASRAGRVATYGRCAAPARRAARRARGRLGASRSASEREPRVPWHRVVGAAAASRSGGAGPASSSGARLRAEGVRFSRRSTRATCHPPRAAGGRLPRPTRGSPRRFARARGRYEAPDAASREGGLVHATPLTLRGPDRLRSTVAASSCGQRLDGRGRHLVVDTLGACRAGSPVRPRGHRHQVLDLADRRRAARRRAASAGARATARAERQHLLDVARCEAARPRAADAGGPTGRAPRRGDGKGERRRRGLRLEARSIPSSTEARGIPA